MSDIPKVTIYHHSGKFAFEITDVYQPITDDAQRITSDFFTSKLFETDFSHPTAWAFYDLFFHNIAIPCSKYGSILDLCKTAERVESFNLPEDLGTVLELWTQHYKVPYHFIKPRKTLKKSIKSVGQSLQRFFFFIYSLISILRIKMDRISIKVAVWSGDYVGQELRLDPRLGDLEKALIKSGFSPIPLIRFGGVSPKQSMVHFWDRKGPVIYYETLNSLLKLLPKKQFAKRSWESTNVYQYLFMRLFLERSFLLEKEINLWKQIFRFLNIRIFIPWFLSNRTASLIWASKSAHIPTIGFMHGVSIKTFMGHEFMSEYSGEPIGPDHFGVWSSWWKQYFDQNARIYPPNSIEISGPLKSLAFDITNMNKKHDQLRIFIVSEAHLPVNELTPYLEKLIQRKNTEIIFKVRPFGTDQFWQAFSNHKLHKEIQFLINREKTPDCFQSADLVVGTHSTAVLEALALNKPILILNTKKWGDYFNLSEKFSPQICPFWVQTPDHLLERVEYVLNQRGSEIWRENFRLFFGENASGSEWVIKKIKTYFNP